MKIEEEVKLFSKRTKGNATQLQCSWVVGLPNFGFGLDFAFGSGLIVGLFIDIYHGPNPSNITHAWAHLYPVIERVIISM